MTQPSPSHTEQPSLRRCFLLLVDGLRADVAEDELAAGRLPHLAQLIHPGGRATAVTAFPSTTSVAYLPFLTGCLPGRCNIPSIRWLSRAEYRGRWWRDREALRSYCGYQAGRLDSDLSPAVRTLFELVPESVAFFTMITRGLTPERDPTARARKVWGTVSHYLRWHRPGDDLVAAHLLRSLEASPPWRFVFAQFPAVDGYTHQTWPTSAKVLGALRRVDRMVGELAGRLRARGWLKDTLILLVSDHGAARVHTHLDLAEWFRAQGVPTLAHPEVWRSGPRAAVMVAGNSSAMVYAQPDQPRARRWPVQRLRDPACFGAGKDLVTALAAEPGVAFVAGEEESGGVRVVNGEGEARLDRAEETIWYQPLGADPLRLGGAFSGSSRAWLERTHQGEFPDAAVQLLDQFRSPRTGDLVVAAREGFDFRRRWEIPEHRSGHGSLIKAHMVTPVWSSHRLPRVALRTADLFPAILDWLGEPIPDGIDGEPVWLPGSEGEVAEGVGWRQFSAP